MYDTLVQYSTSDLALLIRELNREQEEKEVVEEEEALTAVQAGGVVEGVKSNNVLIVEQATYDREEIENEI